MFCATVMWGNKANCWNTTPMLRLWAGLRVTSFPPMMIAPSLGSSKPAIVRRTVVFPEPLGPSSVKQLPASTVNENVVDRTQGAEDLA